MRCPPAALLSFSLCAAATLTRVPASCRAQLSSVALSEKPSKPTSDMVITFSSPCPPVFPSRSRQGPKERLRVTVTISNFTPKPHTPFQWHTVSTAEFDRKQKLLREKFREARDCKARGFSFPCRRPYPPALPCPGLFLCFPAFFVWARVTELCLGFSPSPPQVNYTPVRISAMEDFIGRGDRRLGKVRNKSDGRNIRTHSPSSVLPLCEIPRWAGPLPGRRSDRNFSPVAPPLRPPQVIRRAWELGACNEAWWEGTDQAFNAWDRAISESSMSWKYRQARASPGSPRCRRCLLHAVSLIRCVAAARCSANRRE